MPIDRRSLLASVAAALGLGALPGKAAEAALPFERGTVTWYNRICRGGLGFITLDRPNRIDVVVRGKHLAPLGIDRLKPDQRVMVRWDRTTQEATHVRVVDKI